MSGSEILALYRRRAERVAQLLAGLPFVRLVGLSGSLARGEARPESDIDLLIITAPGRLYTVRFLATFLVHALGLRRYRHLVRGRICLNRYQTANSLTIEPQNRYHAEDLSRLIPLVNLDQTYQRYQEANRWMAEFSCPVSSIKRRPSRSLFFSQWTRRAGEWLLAGRWGDWLELRLRRWQQTKIKRHPLTARYPDRIRVSDSVLCFHPPGAGEIDDNLARWDAAADSYDHLQGLTGDPFRRALLDPAILNLLGPISGAKILDAGCGNGYLTDRLAKQDASVIGVDGSRAMIARATQNFPGRDFRVTDLQKPLPFPDAAFDRIVCSMVLHALADPRPSLGEFRRLLRPTGRLIVAVPHPAFSYPVGRFKHTLATKLFGRSPLLRVSDYARPRPIVVPLAGLVIPTARYHRPLEQYAAWFGAAGFLIEQLREPTGPLPNHRLRRLMPLADQIPLAIIFQLKL